MEYFQVSYDRARGIYYLFSANGPAGLSRHVIPHELDWQFVRQYSDLAVILNTLQSDFWFSYVERQ